MRYSTLALMLCVVGCLTPGSYIPIVRYAIEPEIEVARADPTDLSLGVYALEAGRSYKQKIVYRESPYVVKFYDNAEWVELPADTVTETLIDALNACGRYDDVGYATNMQLPDHKLTGQLRAFDEVRTETPWMAVCEVRLELRDAREGTLVWGDTLSARVPLETQDLPGLAAAMSRAVADVVQSAVADLVGK